MAAIRVEVATWEIRNTPISQVPPLELLWFLGRGSLRAFNLLGAGERHVFSQLSKSCFQSDNVFPWFYLFLHSFFSLALRYVASRERLLVPLRCSTAGSAVQRAR